MNLSSCKYSVGVDIGGTNITVALVNMQGRIIREIKYSTDIKMEVSLFVKQLADKLAEVIMNVPVKFIMGIGIGAAGLIDHEKGSIKYSPNMYKKNVPLLDLLKTAMRKLNVNGLAELPVFLENDANVAAWGAYQLEVESRVKDLICITLGTGVGGGIIIGGEIYHGVAGCAGEIGHMTVEPDGPKCSCGNHGCLESYIGAGNIVHRAVAEIKKGKSTILKKIAGGNLNRLTVKDIAEAAKKNDKLAKKIWDETGEYLGKTVASVINLINPEVIVFCGGVSHAGSLFLIPMKKVIVERSFVSHRKAVKYIISRLSNNLGVVGAALLVRQINDKKK